MTPALRRGLCLTLALAALTMLALPAAADDRDIPAEMAFAMSDIATANIDALLHEGDDASAPDNISCSIGGYGAAHTERVYRPGIGQVNGQDAGEGDGVCSRLDPTQTGPPYHARLDIAFEYLDPVTYHWVEFARDWCERPSVGPAAPITECSLTHQYSLTDPIQGYVRRAVFELFVVGDTEPRSSRVLGPLAPDLDYTVSRENPVCNLTLVAANLTRTTVGGVGTVNGQDVASASAACLDTSGEQIAMRLDLILEYLDPSTVSWVEFERQSCATSGTTAVLIVDCSTEAEHQITDPVGSYSRRTTAELYVNGTLQSRKVSGPIGSV